MERGSLYVVCTVSALDSRSSRPRSSGFTTAREIEIRVRELSFSLPAPRNPPFPGLEYRGQTGRQKDAHTPPQAVGPLQRVCCVTCGTTFVDNRTPNDRTLGERDSLRTGSHTLTFSFDRTRRFSHLSYSPCSLFPPQAIVDCSRPPGCGSGILRKIRIIFFNGVTCSANFKFPDLPGRARAGFRDLLVHACNDDVGMFLKIYVLFCNLDCRLATAAGAEQVFLCAAILFETNYCRATY